MKNENKVTPVRNLCFFILHGWKWIVAAIVALAFVFGLAQGVANNNPVASEESITALDARIATQVAYLENSILMQLDPYNVYEATANLHITQNGASIEHNADSLEIANYICAYYYTALNNNALYVHLTDVTEVMPNFLKELITLDNSSSPILTIKVCHTSAEQADILLQEILDYVQGELPAPAGEYDIQPTILATVDTIRTDIHAKQIQEQTSLDASKAELAKLTASTSNRMLIIKAAFTGGIFGGVLSILTLAVAFLLSSKRRRSQSQ